MLNQAISLLLALNVLSCPFLCQGADVCCAEENKAVEQYCCAACETERMANTDGESPSTPPDQSQQPCQCLCSGAVIENHATVDCQIDLSSWDYLPASELRHSRPFVARSAASSPAPLPDDGANYGRVVRCLISSYLC